MLISSIFEILAIFSIGPLIQILGNPDIIYNQDELISKVYLYLNFSSFESFLVFMVISIFCFLLTSTIILSVTIYYYTMFSQTLGNILRTSLFKFYILQNWLYHSKSNSSEYIEKVTHETNRVTMNIILPILTTNSKLITGILIIISLTIYNPIVSIVCFIFFGSIYGLIFKLVKSRITVHGVQQGITMKEMYRVMNESFVGIKEAIIYGNQKKYHDQFLKIGSRYGNSIGKVQFFTNAPRYILEFIAFSIILFFILFLVYSTQTNFNETLPILAIYIFAGYKLLPIFQSIYIGAVYIKNGIPAYDLISKELDESKEYSFKIDNNKNKLFTLEDHESMVFKNVSFAYNDDSVKAVKDINIEIKKNSLNFIVGSSGSGKSTMLDLILGLINPKQGEIFVGKNKLEKNNSKYWHQNIGYVGQNIFLLDDTIKNNITFANENEEIDDDRFNKAINVAYVKNFLNNLPDGVDTVVGERGMKLSGGQRQRVAIARAFYQNKSILILDEATASLDGIAEKFIIDQLRNLSKSKTIIMVTHNVKLCRDADMIFLLSEGFVKDSGNYDKIKKDLLFIKLLNEQ
jgi:HlyD family secretion protein